MLVAGMRIPEQMRAAVLQVPGELEKGNADRLLPIAPEFALFLMETSEIVHTGPVFRLEGRQGRYRDWEVSTIVSKIGTAAGIKVYVNPKDPEKVKYGSAHDLCRTFGGPVGGQGDARPVDGTDATQKYRDDAAVLRRGERPADCPDDVGGLSAGSARPGFRSRRRVGSGFPNPQIHQQRPFRHAKNN